MSYFVYILQSQKDQRYYIGSTSDVQKRLEYHNSGRQRSTRYRTPFELVYKEEFPTKAEALKRDRQIKSYKGGNAFRRLLNKG
jgi:putative endonuclease